MEGSQPSSSCSLQEGESLYQVGRRQWVFDARTVGRRNPELIARLGELTDMLTWLGCSASPYSNFFAGFEVAKNNTTFPELEPYHDLDPARLVLYGRARWDVTDFLSDELVMAYREPEVLKVDRIPAAWEIPKLRDPVETVASLAHLWDCCHGLLCLHREGVESRAKHELVRVFNC